MKRCASVEEYIEQHPEWSSALTKLRKLLTATELAETIKWGAPCYTLDGKNVVGMAGFKEHCALWFHQGVFLEDALGVLVNAQEGKTKALLQWRFTSAKEISVKAVQAYLAEAIENHRSGKAVAVDRGRPVVVPAELRAALARRPKARAAFARLGKGKQREYAEHIADAKRPATKEARLAKVLPMIEAGAGLNDKYRRG